MQGIAVPCQTTASAHEREQALLRRFRDGALSLYELRRQLALSPDGRLAAAVEQEFVLL